MKDKKTSRDLLLVLVILLIAAGFFLGNYLISRKPAAIVEITVDGKVVKELDLDKDTEVVINGYNSGTNTILIENGKAHIKDASCPDKLCVHQGKISQSGEMIVCLPNRMIAKITGEEE